MTTALLITVQPHSGTVSAVSSPAARNSVRPNSSAVTAYQPSRKTANQKFTNFAPA